MNTSGDTEAYYGRENAWIGSESTGVRIGGDCIEIGDDTPDNESSYIKIYNDGIMRRDHCDGYVMDYTSGSLTFAQYSDYKNLTGTRSSTTIQESSVTISVPDFSHNTGLTQSCCLFPDELSL